MIADDPQQLIATVKAMYEAFNRMDLEGGLRHLAPDVELRPAGTSIATGRRVYRGHDGIREYFADVRKVWTHGLRVVPVDYRAVAGSVVVFGRVTGGDGGQPIDDEVVWVWKLRGGLVTSGQIFSTRGAAMAAARAAAGAA